MAKQQEGKNHEKKNKRMKRHIHMSINEGGSERGEDGDEEREREEDSTEKGRKIYTRARRLSKTAVFGSQQKCVCCLHEGVRRERDYAREMM